MTDIHVSLTAPTPLGRLYFYRDPQIEQSIMYIESNIRRYTIFNINMDARVIIGIDRDRLLKDVEIMAGPKFWDVDENVKLPIQYFPADITFAQVKEHGNYINDKKVVVKTDPEHKVVWVLFGEKKANSNNIALSDQCFAILNEDILVGFIIKIADAPLKIYDKDRFRKPLIY